MQTLQGYLEVRVRCEAHEMPDMAFMGIGRMANNHLLASLSWSRDRHVQMRLGKRLCSHSLCSFIARAGCPS